MNSSYITSAQKAEQLPEFPFQEVAFVGRSNVGKSSLLNALLDRKGLARESNTPGRTQMVNFFSVQKGDAQVILADLPGYGYSAIGKSVRKDWSKLMDGYLQRPSIRLFLFLLDIRRASDLQEDDLALLQSIAACRAAEGMAIVLTKADKASTNEIAKIKGALGTQLGAIGLKKPRVFVVSTLKKKGLDDLKAVVLAPLFA